MSRKRAERTSNASSQQAVTTALQTRDGYERAFQHLCHLVSLTKTGKTRGAIDNLVITAIGLDTAESFRSPDEVASAVESLFGIVIGSSDVRRAIDGAVAGGRLVRARGTGELSLSLATRGQLDGRIADSRDLESAVREEWSLELRAGGYAAGEPEVDQLWSCLQNYMARAFRRHGAMAVELLDARLMLNDHDQESLVACMDGAISETGLAAERTKTAAAISTFFKTTTPTRARYVAQLLDATFTFFALTVNDATAAYLSQSLKPLSLFLDTNFIFGLLGIHENPLSEASRELVSFVRGHSFPFTFYVHERTLKEIAATLEHVADRLLGRRWSPELSRAAITTGTGTGVELAYHRLNAESPVDPKIYLSKFDHMVDLLKDHGVKLYRPPQTEVISVEEKALKIAEYMHFVETKRPGKPKPYEALDHDIVVWISLQRQRKRTQSALDAGALFLTNDVLFRNFDWKYLRDGNVGSVVLPGQLLQVLRPFVKATDDFDKRFVEAFVAPEFRAAQTDYEDTASQVLSYLTTFKDVPAETAVRILTNEMLLARLRQTEQGSEEFKELIESALIEDNAALLEEREALNAQIEEERIKTQTQLAAASALVRDSQTAIEEARSDAARREQSAREEERLLAAQERQRLLDELTQQQARLEQSLHGARTEERSSLHDELSRARTSLRKFRIVTAVAATLIGFVAILTLPHLLHWTYLHQSPHRSGLYGCALLLWSGICWTIGEPRHCKTALGIVSIGAVLGALQLM